MRQTITFSTPRKTMLTGVLWLPENTKPTAVIQIVHGMTEHIGRYEAFAEALNERGFAVSGFDLPGYGINSGSSDCAAFGEKGWGDSLQYIHSYFLMLQQEFLDVPIILLGFSLGSFLVKEYRGLFPGDQLAGIILCGSGEQPALVLRILQKIVSKEVKKYGRDAATPLVDRLSFEQYNKYFTPNQTKMDWLCANQQELEYYLSDPLCKAHISAGLFLNLLTSMEKTGKKKYVNIWKDKQPVLILSGSKDPVGNFGKGIKKMEKHFGPKVTVLMMQDARHDIFHHSKECSENIYTAIFNFVERIREEQNIV